MTHNHDGKQATNSIPECLHKFQIPKCSYEPQSVHKDGNSYNIPVTRNFGNMYGIETVIFFSQLESSDKKN